MIDKKMSISGVVSIIIALVIAAVICIWCLNTLQMDWTIWGWN